MIVPPSPCHSPAMHRSREDLPTPEGPLTSSASPAHTVNVTAPASRTAVGGGVENRSWLTLSSSGRNSTVGPMMLASLVLLLPERALAPHPAGAIGATSDWASARCSSATRRASPATLANGVMSAVRLE
eukprot:scaffold219719_cov26-Tisochrysis_lutea.AAC.2